MKWGTSRADALNIPCVVFASEYAHSQKFYHKHGFQDVAKVVWNKEKQRWPQLPEARVTMMFRPVPEGNWKAPEVKEVKRC